MGKFEYFELKDYVQDEKYYIGGIPGMKQVQTRWIAFSFGASDGHVSIEKEFLEYLIELLNIEQRVANLSDMVNLIEAVLGLEIVTPPDGDPDHNAKTPVLIIEHVLKTRLLNKAKGEVARVLLSHEISDLMKRAMRRQAQADAARGYHRHTIRTLFEMVREDSPQEFERLFNHLIDYHLLRCLYHEADDEDLCYLVCFAGLFAFAREGATGAIWKRDAEARSWASVPLELLEEEIDHLITDVVRTSHVRIVNLIEGDRVKMFSGFLSRLKKLKLTKKTVFKKFVNIWSGFRTDAHAHMVGSTTTALNDGTLLEVDDIDTFDSVAVHVRKERFEDFVGEIRLNASSSSVEDPEMDLLWERYIHELFGNDAETAHEYRKFLASFIHTECLDGMTIHVHICEGRRETTLLSQILMGFLGNMMVEFMTHRRRTEFVISPNGLVIPVEERPAFREYRATTTDNLDNPSSPVLVAARDFALASWHSELTSRTTTPVIFIHELPILERPRENLTLAFFWPMHHITEECMTSMLRAFRDDPTRVYAAVLHSMVSYLPYLHIEKVERSAAMMATSIEILRSSVKGTDLESDVETMIASLSSGTLDEAEDRLENHLDEPSSSPPIATKPDA